MCELRSKKAKYEVKMLCAAESKEEERWQNLK